MTESKGSRSVNRTNYVYILGLMTAAASATAELGHATAEALHGKGLELNPYCLVGAIVGLSIMVLSGQRR